MNSVDSFRFNCGLDHESLDQIYDGDLEYAIVIFEIFLRHSLEEFYSLPQALQQGDLDTLQHLAHKLKTAFTMVGLTDLARIMNHLEKAAQEPDELPIANEQLHRAERDLGDCLPLIKEELRRMKTLAG